MSWNTITLGNQQVVCEPNESVLDALLRENIDIPFGCRAGVCQNCLTRSLDNPPPTQSQRGLKDSLRQNNYFLACLCRPQQDMTISLAAPEVRFTEAIVVEKQALNDDTLLLIVECETALDYRAGQFVNLKRDDGLMRSYSIANSPVHGQRLSFHIRRLAKGRFSTWAHRELKIGDRIAVSDPQGNCYYQLGNPQQNLLLIGTGSGLAPLAGIIDEALQQRHSGEIYLYHGSSSVNGLYWIEEMRQLEHQYDNFHYTPCVSRGNASTGIAQGRANTLAQTALPNLTGWRVYLCGHPDMVNDSKRQAYLQGARLHEIYADAFHTASSTLD